MSYHGPITWSFDPSAGRILFKPIENDRDDSIKNKKDGSISRKIDTRVEIWEDFWKRIFDRIGIGIGIGEESMVFILPEWKNDQRHKWEIFSMMDGFVLREIRSTLGTRDPRNGGNPVEILGIGDLFMIFSRLPIKDLYNSAPVSKSWNYTITNNPAFWKYYCTKHIPDAITMDGAYSVEYWKRLAIHHISDLPPIDPPLDRTFGSRIFPDEWEIVNNFPKIQLNKSPCLMCGGANIDFGTVSFASNLMKRRWHEAVSFFENLERAVTRARVPHRSEFDMYLIRPAEICSINSVKNMCTCNRIA